MDNNVPNSVVREIIAGILANRGDSVENTYYKLERERLNIDEETAKKIGINARMNDILASKVLEDAVPLKEVIDLVLTSDEIKLAKIKCNKWLESEKEEKSDSTNQTINYFE